jgi:paraquat-inducible protein B
MSKPSNPTAIGGFVLGAVILVAVAAITFGGGEVFKARNIFVSYFPGSVKGLKVGSNVLLRGVRVGFVNEVQLIAEVETLEFRTAVYYEIFPDSITLVKGGVRYTPAEDEVVLSVEELIEAGLRAELATESFVTGQLLIELRLHPDKPAVFRGVKVRYPEIPSVPNNIQATLDKIQRFVADLQQKVNVDQVLRDVEDTLKGLSELANSPDLRDAMAGLNKLVNSEATQAIPGSAQSALEEANVAIKDAGQLMRTANERVGPMADGVDAAIEDLRTALGEAGKTLNALQNQVGEDSTLAYQLSQTLREVEVAARSLRVFLDYIERHPEAFLKGKSQ